MQSPPLTCHSTPCVRRASEPRERPRLRLWCGVAVPLPSHPTADHGPRRRAGDRRGLGFHRAFLPFDDSKGALHLASPARLRHVTTRLRSPLLPSAGPVARVDGQAADPDFSLSPWLHALGSLGEEHAWKRQEIAATRGDRALYRARLVVGMVMACTPNGLGDLFLSLKDPSGTIGASVHQKVFTKEDGMVVSVGSVIVLKKVAVFRPSHKACYLNITKENLEMELPHARQPQWRGSSTHDRADPAASTVPTVTSCACILVDPVHRYSAPHLVPRPLQLKSLTVSFHRSDQMARK